MNLQKLNPWNWFKHEDNDIERGAQIPVQREEASLSSPSLRQRDQHPVLQLHQQIDRLFDDVFSAFGVPSVKGVLDKRTGAGVGITGTYRPQVDVSGNEKQYEVALDVPGLSDNDLSIEVNGDVLTISGQKEERNEQKDKQFYRVERSYGAFQRTLSLPADADASAIQANLKEGVLTLTIPRLATKQRDVKRVAISSS